MKINQSAEVREFNCLYKEIENLYYEISIKAGLSDTAFLIMYSIVELGDGCLQKDIAQRYFISRQTISSSVRSLERKGYIYLTHGKGRNMHLNLTPDGKKFADEKIVPLIEIEGSVFEEMSDEDIREFLRLSRKYNDIFKEKVKKLL